MNLPLVSIITPAFNCMGTIKETHKSVCSQSFDNWEWIIIDDCSSDGSYEYFKKISCDDSRIIVLSTAKNSGAAIARNLGILKARGRYIAFLDSDDLYEKEKLKKQILFMKENGYAFTFTDYNVLYANGKTKSCITKHRVVNYKMLLKSNYIGCLTVVYDSFSLGKIMMPVDCDKREDHGAWLDITKKGILAYKLEECLSTYRLGIKTVSSNKIRMAKYQYKLYRNHEKFGVFKSLWYVFLCSIHKIFRKY